MKLTIITQHGVLRLNQDQSAALVNAVIRPRGGSFDMVQVYSDRTAKAVRTMSYRWQGIFEGAFSNLQPGDRYLVMVTDKIPGSATGGHLRLAASYVNRGHALSEALDLALASQSSRH